MIFFDNDLGEEMEGYDAAHLVTNICMDRNIDIPLYYLQSANPVGVSNMQSLFINFKKHFTPSLK